MKSSEIPCLDALTESVELTAGQQLVIERHGQKEVLKILGAGGEISLAIHVTKEGPVLRFGQAGLTIQADGDLRIAAEQVAIHGRKGMTLSTGGDLNVQAEGDAYSNARIQKITAELGDVDIRANDDVKFNGERIRMNC